jgi:hypothetical protein
LDGLSVAEIDAEIDIGPDEVVQAFVVAPGIVYATKGAASSPSEGRLQAIFILRHAILVSL